MSQECSLCPANRIPLANLRDVPNGAVLAHHKDLKPPILVCPDRQVVCFSNLRLAGSPGSPTCSKMVLRQSARHARGRHRRRRRRLRVVVELPADIERCLEPSKSNCRLWFWLCVPALMPPVDTHVQRLSCHRLQNAPLPGAKTSRWPSAFFCTNWLGKIAVLWGSERSKRSLGLPRLSQSLHPAFGKTCQMCQRASSSAMTNSSWRPSALRPTVMRSEPRMTMDDRGRNPGHDGQHLPTAPAAIRRCLPDSDRPPEVCRYSRRRILLVCHPDFSRR